MTTVEQDRFTRSWQEWHQAREETLAEPFGWLSITELHWLTGEPQRFAGIPGTWHEDGDAAIVAGEGELAVAGTERFELVNSGPGHLIDAGRRKIELARRSGYVLRVHDPESPARTGFRGVPAYEAYPAWVLEGVFEPFAEPREVTVGAVVEGLSHVYTSPGVLAFEHDGKTHRLTAFNGRNGTGFTVLFTDETSGVTTYAANRSLAVGEPDAEGRVRLDFNRALNLPCAFIDFATCPLPPAGNHLSFAVTAGEKTPYGRG
ncbi:DUF1684 domain-containing protein [Amycolatopsis pithecellobii]|uniref:DUF1684 domain-containing protein n=1 Tax=Amycolatopsis pithecellobii TaxID=664692 RepID=A0A6N7YY83_9PSEU|nr:DUF1684 domain-containing protein [Amycolatopsis pithecellobii]MTD56832.1 DUF1684 domain-containing protein [Amycolatopsis pithecellobii]